jgi:hypothetical protein
MNGTNFSNNTTFDLEKETNEQAIKLCLLGAVTTVLSYFQVSFWMMPAERQSRIIRKKLFSSILKQYFLHIPIIETFFNLIQTK